MRRIGQAAYVLRALVDAIEAAGSKNVAAHRAALDLVDARVRGEATTPAQFQSAREAVKKACERYANAYKLGPLQAALYAIPVDSLLWMAERGDDRLDNIVERAASAVVGADTATGKARVEALLREADSIVIAEDAPAAPLVRPPSARTLAREAALLAHSRAALPILVQPLLDEVGAARDAKRVGSRAKLERLLARHDLPASEAIFAFEETFGGLLVRVTKESDAWRQDGMYTLVGAFALLESGYRPHQRDDLPRLVPVAYGLQDDAYFLDAEGRPWYHDPTGDRYVVEFGDNGVELVARLVMAALTYASQCARDTLLWPSIERANTAARSLELTKLFANERSEWWLGDPAIVVMMQGRAFALARSAQAIDALRG
ncbi:MAG: hypothetical protein U0271_17345 [Polyangiaceae bacterium]